MTLVNPQTPELTFNQIHDIVKNQIKVGIVPFFAGEPGIGKSANIKNIARELNTKVFVMSINQIGTRDDLTGTRTVPDKNDPKIPYKQIFFPHAIIKEAIDYAKAHPDETPLLFLDEINRTSPDVTSAILALITERRLGTVYLPDNIRIIAAGNDKGNVNSLDLASITRMAIYHVKPDVKSFVNAQPELNHYVKQLVLKSPDYLIQTTAKIDDGTDPDDDDDDMNLDDLNNLFDESSIRQMTVPRTLTATSKLLNQLGFDGQSLPSNVDKLIDIMDPEQSPLYFGIQSQLGQTKATDDLFNAIQADIEKLQTTNTNTQKVASYSLPTNINVSDITELSSDDETNDFYQQLISNHSAEELKNFFGFISITNNLKAINNPQAVKVLFTNVLKDKQNVNVLQGIIKNVNQYGIDPQIADLIENTKDTNNSELEMIQKVLTIMMS